MRIANDSLQDGATSMNSTFEMEPIFLGHIVYYSIQLVFTGSPTGNFKLQASNDKGLEDKRLGGWDSSGVSNWTDIADSQQAITAAGDHAWTVENAGYRWVRVVWTQTAGTGSLDSARFNAKGI